MDVFMDRVCGKELFLEITALVEELGIPYFLQYGTALGAYRDHGFTPTETDIDLGFLSEDFVPRAGALATALSRAHYSVYCLTRPFERCWAIKARKENIGIDLVSNAVWGQHRLNPSTLADYCDVYPASLLENYHPVELFGHRYRLPSPPEAYLTHEYGPNWRIPRHDCTQRSRIEGYWTSAGVPARLLNSYGPALSCGPLFLSALHSYADATDNEEKILAFYAGLVTGEAEKVSLGACPAAVFRPSGMIARYWPAVLKIVVELAELYSLYTLVVHTRRGRDIWLCRTLDDQLAASHLATLEEDSPEWHSLRGRLCGVPEEELDRRFHERYL